MQAQEDSLVSSLDYQNHLNEEFANQETSPLTEDDLESFQSLSFFDIDEDYIVKAKFIKTESVPPFVMPTTTERKPIYMKYGEF